MMELLRDPLWQFVGAILTLLAIGASVLIYWLRRRKKRLSYEIVSSNSLLSMRDELGRNLEIKYGGREVENVHLVNVKVYNSGNVPIKSDDFERRLSLDFGDGARVLSSEVRSTDPESLDLSHTDDLNKISFEPVLLNSKDSFSVKALVSEYEGDLSVDARIVGVSSIRRGPEGQRTTLVAMAVGMILILIGGLLSIYSEPVGSEPIFENKTRIVATITLVVGYSTVLFSMIRHRRYRRLLVRAFSRLFP